MTNLLYVIWDAIVWLIVPSGIVSRGVAPSADMMMHFHMLHKVITKRHCYICDCTFWSWRESNYCSFKHYIRR